jgi:hypothetical protein
VLTWRPPRSYRAWHDRAVFHFLTNPADRATYVNLAASAVTPGGFLIVATFALGGPTHCSGLPVARYGPDELAAQFAPHFASLIADDEQHHTPWGGQAALHLAGSAPLYLTRSPRRATTTARQEAERAAGPGRRRGGPADCVTARHHARRLLNPVTQDVAKMSGLALRPPSSPRRSNLVDPSRRRTSAPLQRRWPQLVSTSRTGSRPAG